MVKVLIPQRFPEEDIAFGDYTIELQDDQSSPKNRHAVIRRKDGGKVDPTFYEMQHMKCLAFGGRATAIEVFPDSRKLVDGQNQRHLWLVDVKGFSELKNTVLQQWNK